MRCFVLICCVVAALAAPIAPLKQVGDMCLKASDCSSNNCDNSVCAKVQVPYGCRENGDCTSNNCDITLHLCARSPVGTSCLSSADCTSNNCDGNICSPHGVTLACEDDSDCTSRSCVNLACAAVHAVPPPYHPDDNMCFDNTDCTSTVCAFDMGNPAGPAEFKICKQNNVIDPPVPGECGADSDCTSNHCDMSHGLANAVCASVGVGGRCAVDLDCITENCVLGTCRKNSPGGSCLLNSDCDTGICFTGATPPVCAGDLGHSCTTVAQMMCTTGNCPMTTCDPASVGTGFCWRNGDCTNNNCTINNAPNDWSGAPGMCQPAQVGSPCSAFGDCMSGFCSTDGVCAPSTVGQANGDCRTGADCTSGFCAFDPTGMGSFACGAVSPPGFCAVAADCTTSCDTNIGRCLPLASTTACNFNSECQSFLCDTTCILCTQNSDCGSGRCKLPDGRCEQNEVGGQCSDPADCTTFLCDQVCLVSPVGGFCSVDTDCTSLLCDSTRGICQANSVGGQCYVNEDCVTGACSTCDDFDECLGEPGECEAVPAGGACRVGADCSTDICLGGRCQVSDFNGHCDTNEDCGPMLFCAPPTTGTHCHEHLTEDVPYKHCEMNLCAMNNGWCDPHADCIPDSCETKHCKCKANWFGDGILWTVRSLHHLTHKNFHGCRSPCESTVCDPNAACFAQSENSAGCRCNSGYVSLGGTGLPGDCLQDPCLFDSSDTNKCGLRSNNQVCTVVLQEGMAVMNDVSFADYKCSCRPGFYANAAAAGACQQKPSTACTQYANWGGLQLCQCGTGLLDYGHCQPVGVVTATGQGQCNQPSDCTSLKCGPREGSRKMFCLVSKVGEPCYFDSDCTSGNCDRFFSRTCQANGRGGRCEGNTRSTDCLPGYFCNQASTKHGEKFCAINKCADNNGGCAEHALCTPLGDDLRICSCPNGDGYFGTGYAFNPEIPASGCTNPCEPADGYCHPDAECRATSFNTAACTCPTGMVGDGVGPYGCLADKCHDGSIMGQVGYPDHNWSMCPSYSSCKTVSIPPVLNNGYVTCVCDDPTKVYQEPTIAVGAQYVGACIHNACLDHNGGCPVNAECRANFFTGTPECLCRSGFSPQGPFTPQSGTRCARDACSTLGPNGVNNNGGCAPHATCTPNQEAGTRTCQCNSGYVGNGIFCVVDPCNAPSTPCDRYAHTVCVGVFAPPVGSGGPSTGTGPQARVSCQCATGYAQALAAPDQYGFYPCSRTCAVDNGGCDPNSVCRMRGNTPICTCKRGFSFTKDVNQGPVFEAVVSPGEVCVPSPCLFPSANLGANGITPAAGELPPHANVGDCVGVLPGWSCHLGCEPSFGPRSVDATLVHCVGTATGAVFELPTYPHDKPPCVSATHLGPPSGTPTPNAPPAPTPTVGTPVGVPSLYGEAWTCTRLGSEAPVCKPVIKRVTRGFSRGAPQGVGGYGSALIQWKPLGHKLHITSVRVDITQGDKTNVLQTPPNPQQANPASKRDESKSLKTLFQGLVPGGIYQFTMFVDVEISAGQTVTYISDPVEIQACTADC